MAKSKELKEETKVSMFEFSEITNQLIEQRKREFADIQHNYSLAQAALMQTQQRIGQEKVAFEQWKKAEAINKEKDFVRRQQELDAKEHALDVNVKTFEKRSAELKQKEVAVARLFEDRQKLNEDRIAIERIRTSANELMATATRKDSEAKSAFNSARQKEEEAKKIKALAEAMNAEVSKQQEVLKKRGEEVLAKVKHLEEIQKLIEPKIKELEAIETRIADKEKELSVREKEVARKVEEDKAIVITFSDREKKLKAREIEVDSREQDIARKLLLIKGSEK